MLSSPLVQQNPELLVFLPVLYAVWSDDILTPGETEALTKTIQQQKWLAQPERDLLSRYLNPKSPPDPQELKSWLGEIQRIQPDPAKRETLTDIGLRLVQRRQNGSSKLTHELALREIESQLGAISGEAVFQFHPSTRKTATSTQETKATFPIAEMTSILDGRDSKIIQKVKTVISDPAFTRKEMESMAAYREQVLQWCKLLADQGFGSIGYPLEAGGKQDMRSYFTIMETLSYHDLSLVVKFGVQFGLWGMSVYFLGTEKHHKKYLKDIGTLALPGCFAMTETGHGSNVRGIETTATYSHDKKSFTIHTPNELARKEYIGNAATHGQAATVFAKLIIDGKDYGVSAFVVPIRDKEGKTLRGVTIKDCGRKMGLNGVDNGVIYFDNVVIPKEDMLDRYASVSDDGAFVSPITSDNRRFFTMLGTLVGGRIGIPRAGLSAAKAGLAIAIKYGDQRRQFGPEGGAEVPILNYQTHQRRLMPLLANAYALHFALQYLTERFLSRTEHEMQEIEALAAGLKAFGTWNTTRTLQECRESCGGKGYLSVNRIDDFKNDTDIFTTFEGDNTVLLQLVAKSRLSEFKQEFSNMNLFGMLNYLADQAKTSIQEKNPFIIRNTEDDHLLDPAFHLDAFRYRERSVLTSAAQRLKAQIDSGVDSFDAFNRCQSHLVQVGHAYVERIVLEEFQKSVDKVNNPECKAVLKKLCSLFALSQLEVNKGWYLENGYMEGGKTKAIRRMVDKLVSDVREEAVPLVDAFNIPQSCLAPISVSTVG